MATIDQQFVEYIVKTLVNNPGNVAVDRTIDEKGVLLSLTVDPEDVGRVIGKRGATAQSIRTLLRALGTKNDARYNLKIVNTDDYTPAVKGDKKAEAADKADKATEAPVEAADAPAAAADDDLDLDDADEETSSELAEKTRAELADLDDLDI